ncbi:hypothetical protein D1007_40551 [Hordeum vulgare]|nr:hypothetical protein D1007_40551 [Hordeum vulgare]
MTDEHIDYPCRTRKLLSAEHIKGRAPDDEHAPEPHAGERAIFGTHFLVGFGLPAHDTMPYSCSGAVVYRRHGGLFPEMKWIGSFKKWQRNFFAIRNIGLGRD